MGNYLRKKNAARKQRLKDSSAVDSFMGRKANSSKVEESGNPVRKMSKIPIGRTQKERQGGERRRSEVAYGQDGSETLEAHKISNDRVVEILETTDPLHGNQDHGRGPQENNDGQGNLQVAVQSRRKSPSRILYLDSGSADPFSSAAAPVGAWEHHLIQFFVECLTPDVYGGDKESRDSLMARKAHQMAFHQIIQDAGSLFSLFAVSCANEETRRMLKPNPESSMGNSIPKSSFYYRMKVIQVVRQAIDNIKDPARDINDRLIGIMLGLLGADWATADYAAAFMHIKAICHLVKMRGGIQTLNERWAEDVVIADVSMAVSTVAAPILPLTWTPAALPESSRLAMVPAEESKLHLLGQRLLDAQSSSTFSTDLTSTIYKLRSVTWIVEYANHPVDEETRNRRWVSVSTPGAEHRLLSFHQYHAQLSDQPMQQCVSIALLMFIRSSLHYLNYRGQVYLLPLLMQLKSDLLWTDLQTLWSPFTDILLWVLCMGCFAADKCGDLVQLRWFARLLERVVGFLLLKEWWEVETLLEEFFYLERIHGDALKRLWEELICPRLQLSEENDASLPVQRL